MPELPHLILPRAEFDLPRKKTGFGRVPDRPFAAHGRKLRRELDGVVASFRDRPRLAGIDPALILRVQLDPKSAVDEDTWERCGLLLLSIDEHKTLVLFASDRDLAEFRRRLDAYRQGPPNERQKSAPHTGIFAAIDEIGEIRPQDRIGRILRSTGVSEPRDFDAGAEYSLDVELWDFGSRTANVAKAEEFAQFIATHEGRVTDRYVGESLSLLRAKCKGDLARRILEIDYIAVVDLPPKPTLSVAELVDVGMDELPAPEPPDEGAPSIAVLDSGLAAAHPLLAPAVGEATTVPLALGDAADAHGHGTMVAGLALYGDVAECIRTRTFVPTLVLYSARVLNERNEFDDEQLITSQMRQSIEYFRNTYGCRVFNVSLGDPRLPYRGGKVSPWASVLDTLARELDVVIVVSAGNHEYDPGQGGAHGVLQHYPRYLVDDAARIIEPATGAIVLAVGALAHSANVPPGAAGTSVAFRPIAQAEQPSPFTRSGPGLGNAVKPDLCEYGGNTTYDAMLQRARHARELSVISTHREYIQRLFTTDAGTSYAAPRVAHYAARLLSSFPDATANLVRAFLAASARVPEGAANILEPLGDNAVLRVCGYGRPDLESASASGDARVVLYAEGQVTFDNFHIYEVPIPDEFIEEDGTRRISVVLAFDPPVRHTRFDYLGVNMSFRLIRGKTVDEVAEAFRSRTSEEGTVDRLSSTNYDCSMSPSPNLREGGTLQKGVFEMKRRPKTDYGDTYYLVVRCERKWAREEHSPQRYAAVVVLEHSAGINIHLPIQQRVQARLRIRQRARGRAR